MPERYQSLQEFYPFYLSQHSNPICRVLHYIGSSGVLVLVSLSLVHREWQLFLLAPFFGYGFAWIGHFFFEKNSPATFRYPWYSFLSDWIMLKDFFLGNEKPIDNSQEISSKSPSSPDKQ